MDLLSPPPTPILFSMGAPIHNEKPPRSPFASAVELVEELSTIDNDLSSHSSDSDSEDFHELEDTSTIGTCPFQVPHNVLPSSTAREKVSPGASVSLASVDCEVAAPF
jgi:hypothetical protein